jgi:hypothetical protein
MVLPRARRALARAAQGYDCALQRAPLLTKSVSSGLVSGAQRARADGGRARSRGGAALLCADELD